MFLLSHEQLELKSRGGEHKLALMILQGVRGVGGGRASFRRGIVTVCLPEILSLCGKQEVVFV